MRLGFRRGVTLPLKNVSLAEWSNSSKENGNDENGYEASQEIVHGLQQVGILVTQQSADDQILEFALAQ